MELNIKIEDPTEREVELINELSKIESEKAMEERRYMEDTFLSKFSNMFQSMQKKENSTEK